MKLDRGNQFLLLTVVVLSLVAGLRVWQSLRPAAAFWTVDPIAAQAVVAVSIEGPGGTVRLERTDSSWALTEPQRSPADKEQVEGLLQAWSEGFAPDLRLLNSGSEEQVLDFELDSEHRTRLVFEGQNKPLLEVDLGKRNPGGSRYLRPSGSRGVFLGRVPGTSSLSTRPEDWADRRLFAFARQDLASITIRGTEGDFSFDQDDEGRWTSTQPPGLEPSAHRLDILSRTLAGLRARRALEGAEAGAARPGSGVDSPRIEVILATRNGQGYRVKIGEPLEDEQSVWASIDEDPRLLVLPSSIEQDLDRGLAGWQDTTVLRLKRQSIQQVRWIRPGRSVVLAPNGPLNWRVITPVDATIDPKELKLAMNSLLHLQASAVAPPDAPEFREGHLRVEVVTDEGTQVLHLSEEADSEGAWLARVDGRGTTFVLRGAVVQRLAGLF